MSDAHRVLRLPVLLFGAGLAFPVPAGAAPRPNITLQLTAEDGSRIPPVDVSDLSVALMRTNPSKPAGDAGQAGQADKGDETLDQASVSLDVSALSNPALVNWVGKGGGNSSMELKVVTAGQATTYVLTGITTWSLSMNHSSSSGDGQVSLSVGAKHMTINGNAVN